MLRNLFRNKHTKGHSRAADGHQQPHKHQSPSTESDHSKTSTDYEDDSLSVGSNASSTSSQGSNSGLPPVYVTHTFQQRFHEDHPPASNNKKKMKGLSTFMKQAVIAAPNKKKNRRQQQEPPVWWSFDRDYDPEQEENESDWEDLDAVPAAPPLNSKGSSPPTSPSGLISEVDEDEDDDDEDEYSEAGSDPYDYGQQTKKLFGDDDTESSLLFTQNSTLFHINNVSDLGSNTQSTPPAAAAPVVEEGPVVVPDTEEEPQPVIPQFYPPPPEAIEEEEDDDEVEEDEVEEEEEEEDYDQFDTNARGGFQHDFSNSNNEFSSNNDLYTNNFLEDAPVRPTEPKMNVERCFESIKFLSPEDFDTLQEATDKEKQLQADKEKVDHSQQVSVRSVRSSNATTSPEDDHVLPQTPSLSTMVHTMDPNLFPETPEELEALEAEAKARSIIANSVASGSCDMSTSTGMSSTIREGGLRSVDEYDQLMPEIMAETKDKNRFDSIRKKLSSSFRSKATDNTKRVCYSLGLNKESTQYKMSKEERTYAKSLLPPKPLLSRKERQQRTASSIPRGLPSLYRDRPLSILLINPVMKIFEIVLIDILKDTTVGDTLSKARATATDKILSEQRYKSLCNRKQELAAPMLPVSLLVNGRKKHIPRPLNKLADADALNVEKRREMESRLLVAVPEGYSADDCQRIRRMLWMNPKVQRWWQQENPFRHPDEERDAGVPIEIEANMDNHFLATTADAATSAKTTFDKKEKKSQKKKKMSKMFRRSKDIKYAKLDSDDDDSSLDLDL